MITGLRDRNAAPGNPLYDRGIAMTNDVIGEFTADVTNNTLPQVSWVVAPDLGNSEQPVQLWF